MYDSSTVAAISTPPGRGGIGIVRISGPDALEVADRVFRPAKGKKGFRDMDGYTAKLGTAEDAQGRLIDQCIALCFRAPRSYTGEDVAELQCHGGEAATRAVLRAVLEAGAVPAPAGEFTRRAFLNGRISLTQAEAVMDLINAATAQGERAAAGMAEGSLAAEADRLRGGILKVQTQLAAEIDFPEEDVEPADRDEVGEGLAEILGSLRKLLDSYETGQKVLRGVPAAIVGSPNVGKSTLLNLISGYDRAIVSDEAGTTRDVLEENVVLAGTQLLLADTAGIRDRASGDIERMGIERARQRLERSSLIIAVFDGSRELSPDDLSLIEELRGKPVLAVINKTDLKMKADASVIREAFPRVLELSAKDPAAVSVLEDGVAQFLGTGNFDPDAPLLANERQRACAADAADAVGEALRALRAGLTLDVCYALLDEALQALYRLSGENAAEQVIDAVFSEFCVGK